MNRKLPSIISAATALVFTAWAQDTTSLKPERADSLNGALKAGEVIGMTVKNEQDETLAQVVDLAVDVESGRIVQVILSTGGLTGKAEMLKAVPPGALRPAAAGKVLHLFADREKLKSAPPFEMTKWAENCDAAHLSAVYHHFGEEPAFRFIQRAGVEPASVNPSMIPTARLSQIQKAAQIIGLPVTNKQDQKIGEVENMLVDLPAGRVVAVIVSSGSFLGISGELTAVPPAALRFNEGRDGLLLDASKERLGSAPHFKADEWPDFGRVSYVGSVYRAYQVEPYFPLAGTTPPDNTARNKSDQDTRALTPLDQGSSKADMETTVRIRRDIIATKNMSVNAKNVKIITLNGRVTLRGPVGSTEEKRLIGEIADRVAGPQNVVSQLEAPSAVRP